jgi:hypothetical protein
MPFSDLFGSRPAIQKASLCELKLFISFWFVGNHHSQLYTASDQGLPQHCNYRKKKLAESKSVSYEEDNSVQSVQDTSNSWLSSHAMGVSKRE